MARPNTKGKMRNHILEMEIGDYFPVQLGESDGSGTDNQISPLDWQAWGKNVWKDDIPAIKDKGVTTSDGVFYFIKVDDGLLIADRIVRTDISHHILKLGTHNNYIQGKLMVIDGVEGVIRSLKGGITWADEKGKPIYTAPKYFTGAYPIDNEWDKYIVKSDLGGKVIPNDQLVWNHFYHETITQGLNNRSIGQCVCRGGSETGANFIYRGSTYTNTTSCGFRPVFDFGYKNR